MLTRLMFAFLIAVLLVLPRFGTAADFAILIGVSDYDQTAGLPDLRGPANDVNLMQEVLAARGFEVTVLADGIASSTRPTRSAILAALDALTNQVGADDFVYLHFSGLGTQLRGASGARMDAVFLPADAARSGSGNVTMTNALRADDFAARIAAMRTTGADVWLVLDSCHADPVLKIGSPRAVARCTDAAHLGIEAETSANPYFDIESAGLQDLPGGLLVFHASLAPEQAREVQIDEADASSWYGLLTSRLATRLQSVPRASYRALFEHVASGLSDAVLPGAARLQTPRWQGNLIDTPVFGEANSQQVQQFAVNGDQLLAGKLHGLQDNMIVALFADTDAGPHDIIGYAQLHQTDVHNARLFGVPGDCAPRVSAPCSDIGPVVEGAAIAQVIARPTDTTTRIAPPVDLTTGEPLDGAHPLYAALAQAILSSDAEDNTSIRMDPNAVILTGVYDGALWFGERLSAGETPMGLRWTPEDGPVEFVLRRIVQAERVAKTLTNLAGPGPDLLPHPFDLRITRRIADAGRLAEERPADLAAECAAAQENAVLQSGLSPAAHLKQCDVLEFEVQDKAQGPARDVNRVHIDSQYCVSASYQRVEGGAQSVMVGKPMSICSDCLNGDAVVQMAGSERAFFLISKAAPDGMPMNLEGVIDTCLSESGAIATEFGQDSESDFLAKLGQLSATRDGLESVGVSNLWVETVRWQVLPRSEALKRVGR